MPPSRRITAPARVRLGVALSLLLALGLTGCAPSLSPLYKDYRIGPAPQTETAPDTSVYARIRAALSGTGWEEVPPEAPNVVSTAPREMGDRLLYRITVSLDVAPIGDRHVRVFFHPYRRFITGGRSKISHLSGSLRAALLADLNAAFEAHGLLPLRAPRERDEAATDET
ncbi:MAG: hypothetical protein R3362_09590 [Rhodothermales bacterium]|nr:hypothetical protein [Rhodothermales bacterium]